MKARMAAALLAALLIPAAVSAEPGSGSHVEALAPSLEEMAQKLETQLAAHPNDPGGWFTLGQTYAGMGAMSKAAAAYKEAAKRSDKEPAFLIVYGEALMHLHGGKMSQEAEEAFHVAAEKAPSDPRPRFYLGIAQQQRGDIKGALTTWGRLVASAPADAPWKQGVSERVTSVAKEANLDPTDFLPDDKGPKAKAPEVPQK